MATQEQRGISASADGDAALHAALHATRYSATNSTPDPEAFTRVQAMCPALSSEERYADYQYMGDFCGLEHLYAVIEANDLPAMLEFIRAEPGLLTLESPTEMMRPPLVMAVKLGRNDLVAALVKYRASVPPSLQTQSGYDDWQDRGSWGTPLTTACAMGRLDTLKLLLDGMPDADINEVDNLGLTPFLAAASNRHGPTDDRLALLRFLMERGADVHAVQRVQFVYDDDLKRKAQNEEEINYGNYDEDNEDDDDDDDDLYGFRPRPGGYGNALALAMDHPDTDPAILKFLVETGVDVYQSRAQTVRHVAHSNDLNDPSSPRDEWAFLSPLAIGALYRNPVGIKTLLDLFPNDHGRLLASTDATITPSPWPEPPTPEAEDDNAVPVILPLHAALLGFYAPIVGYMQPREDNTAAALDVVRLLTADETIRAATINALYRQRYTPVHMATGFDRIPMLQAVLEELGGDATIPRHDGQGLILALFSSVSRLSPKINSLKSIEWAVAVDAATDMHALLTMLLNRCRPRGEGTEGTDDEEAAARLALLNEADANGNTALHFAMGYRLERSTAALQALGARTDAVNKAGEVPAMPPHFRLPKF
ncbi:hypothetical protein Sste5346_007918 [Sporothrix stenoceras]|uniref:Ankyrin repeat protein n=1 Tax=Sporothrix stenoceras TaxID=5173 RepID=A0ABR3YSL8_9PEZI